MKNDFCVDSAAPARERRKVASKAENRFGTRGLSLGRRRCLFTEDSEGGALVEMAVTLPVIMAIMTGIFSFSMALYQKLQLSEAISNAGRLLATDRGDTDPCNTATNAFYAAAPGLAHGSLTLTYTLNGTSYGSGTTTCPGSSGAANANMVSGGTAQLNATFACSLGVFRMKAMTCSLQQSITEVVQ
jgi:Flp pilus assembly protein TadG